MKVFIDLLPESRKSLAAKKRRFKKIIKQEILFIFPLLLFIFMLLSTNFIIDVQNFGVELSKGSSDSQNKYKELKLYEDQAKAINEKVLKLKKFKEGHVKWSNILDDIIDLSPEGVSLSDFSTNSYNIFLIGEAKDRNVLIAFQEKIESSECFENVKVPLSNLVVKENVDFQMDFQVKKECLINKQQ